MSQFTKKLDKPAKSADFLLKLIIERGVKVEEHDELEIKNYIRSIGYFRLSGYFGPFQSKKDIFKSETTFSDIIRLYTFDRELKLLFFDVIETIEIELRARITDIMSLAHGEFWYNREDLFKEKTEKINICYCEIECGNSILKTKEKEERIYKILLKDINDCIKQSENSEFMKAFIEKYGNETPVPSWMMMECISFGKLSRLFWLIKEKQEKNKIAQYFGAINSDFLESWMHGISVLRNICAHHSRLWNKKIGKDIKIPTRSSKKFILTVDQDKLRKLYGISSCILHILTNINHEKSCTFKKNFIELSKEYKIDKKAMGFPDNWKDDEIWKD